MMMTSGEFRRYVRGYLALSRGKARHGKALPDVKIDRAWAAYLLASHRRAGNGLTFADPEIAENWPWLIAAFARAGHKPHQACASHNVAEDGVVFTSAPEPI
jgi:hypothetical protein